ncbi:hypothetical protein ANOM_004085 [Aspergillus nomiae NRRL 13137]|uniref:Uncharacterized protein n=1 Tax=Aspergillus nomiae NRRL (strain ATCC 15546 / NRRL 13137 / CBS 260.88 / M93) TaxID=1509407 RepID=A0A0L1J8P1_ASPN3|nr:uncharacterized protein ANOM_004085 [Aspergillus nomiae NRRL 13137]KNG88045.1 hypothetical protein ANOM_004085 [Aspergillus nomiae NRRL 13137]
MALAYPEGECFFRRAALNHKDKNCYQADRVDHFYGHFLVEFLWNVPAHTGDKALQPHSHPRSTYKKHDFSIPWGFMSQGREGPYIGCWTHLPFHNLCTWAERLKKQVDGDAMEVVLVYGDADAEKRLANIRAIYIPVAHQASEDHPELCTFQHVNFAAADATINMLHHTGDPKKPNVFWKDVTFSKTRGLQDWNNLTLGININGLVNLLSLPRQLRVQNAFTSKNIIMLEAKMVASPKVEQTFMDHADFDWAQIARANFGLSIQWKPAPQKTDWLKNFLKNSMTVAVGFIPGIGSIAAIAFPLAWVAMDDPDSFVETLRNLIPGIDLELKIIEAIRDSAKDVVHAKAALTSDAPKSVEVDDLDTETLINNELKSLAGRSVDFKALVSDAGRPEDQIVILEAETDGTGGVDHEADNRLDDEIDDQGVPDQVTLDELGPNLYFRLAETVLKDTAQNKDESEWAKLVESAVDAAKDLASKVPHLPDLGSKKDPEPTEETGEDPTKSDGPVNDYQWMDKYLESLFSGTIELDESK